MQWRMQEFAAGSTAGGGGNGGGGGGAQSAIVGLGPTARDNREREEMRLERRLHKEQNAQWAQQHAGAEEGRQATRWANPMTSQKLQPGSSFSYAGGADMM